MQQQIPPQEQYGNQQQMSQPMMLCPIQYVYETPMLMPQHRDQQIQQTQQVLFNVQNTPPWIQNRPQNQVVYLQQVPSNYQSYIHPNMMQNHIYHPQMTYQIQQPMLAPHNTQDNRQFVQIPNLTPYNNVQNQTAQPVVQQIKIEETTEKMPLLTQMLSQKPIVNNNVRGPEVSNIRPSTPTLNTVRPVMQNQQVQTEISANNKGRPRNAQPQIITINPMQQRQYMTADQKPDVIINISRPTQPFVRTEVPQHIRSKIPSSISVKTVYRPILPRPLMRPFDVMPAPQNFYYNSNFVTATNNPEMRNSFMNTDNSHLQQINNFQAERNTKPVEANVSEFKKLPTTKNQEEDATIRKPGETSGSAKSKFDLVKIYGDNDGRTTTATNTVKNTESETQTEKGLIRNTVYIQARGRVITENEIRQNQSLKRTIDDRLEEERVTNIANNLENPNCNSSNKYVKVEVTKSTSETINIAANSSVANEATNSDIQQSSNNNIPVNANVKSAVLNIPKPNELIIVPSDLNNPKPEFSKPVEGISSDLDQSKATDDSNIPKHKENNDLEVQEVIDKVPMNNTVIKEETSLKETKQNKSDITVLTHVLDGYIIQESSVAFPIYKPIEKENIQEQEGNKRAKTKTDSTNELVHADIVPHLPWRYWNTINETEKESTEAEKELTLAPVNKDDPFANIEKATVRTWAMAELTAHLEKYGWRETAEKLQDQEIDGESLLLVNREQLVVIGVSEEHADAIAVFAGTS